MCPRVGYGHLERLPFSYLSVHLMISSSLVRRSVGSEGKSPVLAPALEKLHNLVELKHPFEITILIIWLVISQIELSAKKNGLARNEQKNKRTPAPPLLSLSLHSSLPLSISDYDNCKDGKRIQALMANSSKTSCFSYRAERAEMQQTGYTTYY